VVVTISRRREEGRELYRDGPLPSPEARGNPRFDCLVQNHVTTGQIPTSPSSYGRFPRQHNQSGGNRGTGVSGMKHFPKKVYCN
jgi:hypothetical protein